MPSTSSKKRRLSSGLGVSSSAWPMWATSWSWSAISLHTSAQAVQVVRQLAGLELGPLDALLLEPLARRGQHLVQPLCADRQRPVVVQHERVARVDRRAAHLDRDVELADL